MSAADGVQRCGVLIVDPRVGARPSRERPCAQRPEHPGGHAPWAPGDWPRDGCSCTAWTDHCPECAEHVCCCPPGSARR